MAVQFTLYLELTLSILLAATLVYCVVLERRLSQVRKGHEALKSTVSDLNGAINAAASSLRMLKSAASGAAASLDQRLAEARRVLDEFSALEKKETRTQRSIEPVTAAGLPSGSIMARLARAAH
jgi:ABC-type multidrug transport system fused ATPase/permease subunit